MGIRFKCPWLIWLTVFSPKKQALLRVREEIEIVVGNFLSLTAAAISASCINNAGMVQICSAFPGNFLQITSSTLKVTHSSKQNVNHKRNWFCATSNFASFLIFFTFFGHLDVCYLTVNRKCNQFQWWMGGGEAGGQQFNPISHSGQLKYNIMQDPQLFIFPCSVAECSSARVHVCL